MTEGDPKTREVPTLYAWAGGAEPIERLLVTFYEKVPRDPMLAPVFASMSREHAVHVAEFVAEVLGGPPRYSEKRGGHPAMIRHHVGKELTEAQRKRWVALLLECADEVGLPDDPEFRSSLVAYLEWGSRLAVINSRPDAKVDHDAPMPKWGWGETKGPFTG